MERHTGNGRELRTTPNLEGVGTNGGDLVRLGPEQEQVVYQEAEGISTVLNMLNVKMLQKSKGDGDYRPETRLPNERRVYAAEYCRMHGEGERLEEEKTREVKELKEGLKKAEKKTEEMALLKEVIEKKWEETNAELEELKSLGGEMKRELEETREKFRTSQKQLRECQARQEAMRREYQQREEKWKATRQKELETERENRETLEHERNEIQKELEACQVNREKSLEELQKNQRKLQGVTEEFERLQERLQEEIGRVEEMATHFFLIRTAYLEKEVKLGEVAKERDMLQVQLERQVGKTSKHKAALVGAREDLQVVRKELEVARKDLEVSRKDLEVSRKDLEVSRKDLVGHQNKIQHQEQSLNEAESIIREQQKICEDADNRKKKLEKILQINLKLDQKVLNLESGIRSRQEEIESLTRQVTREQEESTKAQVKARKLREAVFSLKTQLDGLLPEIARCTFEDPAIQEDNVKTVLASMSEKVSDKLLQFETNQNLMKEQLKANLAEVEQLNAISIALQNQELVIWTGEPPPDVQDQDGKQQMVVWTGQGLEQPPPSENPVIPNYAQHFRIKDNPKQWICQCNPQQDFGSRNKFKEHLNLIKQRKSIKCVFCPVRFRRVPCLKRHVREKHNMELHALNWNCVRCSGRKFFSFKKLWQHEKLIHTVKTAVWKVRCPQKGKRLPKKFRPKKKGKISRGKKIRKKKITSGEKIKGLKISLKKSLSEGRTTRSRARDHWNIVSSSLRKITDEQENKQQQQNKRKTRASTDKQLENNQVFKTPQKISKSTTAVAFTSPPPPALRSTLEMSPFPDRFGNEIPPVLDREMPSTSASMYSSASLRLSASQPSVPDESNEDEIEVDVVGDAVDDEGQSDPGIVHGVDLDKETSGFFCLCGQVFTKQPNLIFHVNNNTKPWLFSCTLCENKFFSFAYLKRHCQNSHKRVPANLAQFVIGCTGCGKMYRKRTDYHQHRKSGSCKPPKVPRKPEVAEEPGPSAGALVQIKTEPGDEYEFVDEEETAEEQQEANGVNVRAGGTRHGVRSRRRGKGRKRLNICLCGRKFGEKKNLQSHVNYMNSRGYRRLINRKPRKIIYVDLAAIEDRTAKRLKKEVKLKAKHAINLERLSLGFFCICGDKFATRKTLGVHVENFTTGKMFECNICEHRFKSVGNLRNHQKTVHKVTNMDKRGKLFGCKVCGRLMTSLGELKRHRKIHQEQDEEDDEVPEENEEEPEENEEVPEENEEVPEENEEVPESVSQEPEVPLMAIIKREVIEGEQTERVKHVIDWSKQKQGFFCRCGNEFGDLHSLKVHVSYYQAVKEFKCTQRNCQEKFASTSKLRQHLLEVHKNGEELWGCRLCGKMYSVKEEYLQHKKDKHARKRPEQVDLTVAQAPLRTPARAPPQVATRKARSLIISSARKSPPRKLARRSPIRRGRRRHDVDLTKRNVGFFCICGSKCSSKMNLTTHIQYFTSEKMFRCEACSVGFLFLSQLKKHLRRTHAETEENLDKLGLGCSVCGEMGFESQKAVMGHRKKEHANIPEDPAPMERMVLEPMSREATAAQRERTLASPQKAGPSSRATRKSPRREMVAAARRKIAEALEMTPPRPPSAPTPPLSVLARAAAEAPRAPQLPPPQVPVKRRRKQSFSVNAPVLEPDVLPTPPTVPSPPTGSTFQPEAIPVTPSPSPTSVPLTPAVAVVIKPRPPNNLPLATANNIPSIPLPTPPDTPDSHGIDLSKTGHFCNCGMLFPNPDALRTHVYHHATSNSKRIPVTTVPAIPSSSTTSTSKSSVIRFAPKSPTLPLTSTVSLPSTSTTVSSIPSTSTQIHKRVYSTGRAYSNKFSCFCGDHYTSLELLQNHIATYTQQQTRTTPSTSISRLTISKTGPIPPPMSPVPSIIIPTGVQSTSKRSLPIPQLPYPPTSAWHPITTSMSMRPIKKRVRPAAAANNSAGPLDLITNDLIVDAHISYEPYRPEVVHAVDFDKEIWGFHCVCGQECGSKAALRSHIKYFTADRKFVCKTCGHGFLGANLLRNHMLKVHKIVYNISNGCKECGATFVTNMELFEHFRSEHNQNAVVGEPRDIKYVPPPHLQPPTSPVRNVQRDRTTPPVQNGHHIPSTSQQPLALPPPPNNQVPQSIPSIAPPRPPNNQLHKSIPSIAPTPPPNKRFLQLIPSIVPPPLPNNFTITNGHSSNHIASPPTNFIYSNGQSRFSKNLSIAHNSPVGNPPQVYPLSNVHSTNQLLCKCGLSYRCQVDLTNHIARKACGQLFRCSKCPGAFEGAAALQQHHEIFHKPDYNGELDRYRDRTTY